MKRFFLINSDNIIINVVLAEDEPLAILGCEEGIRAVTELPPDYVYEEAA